MTKKELEQIRYLNNELKMWQRRRQKYQCQSIIKGQQITGMPFVSGTSDKTGDLVTEIKYCEDIIKGIEAKIQIQIREIMKYIESIEDSYIRQIITCRNVFCMSWNQVAKEMGNGYSTDSIRMAYNRFFAKSKCDKCEYKHNGSCSGKVYYPKRGCEEFKQFKK